LGRLEHLCRVAGEVSENGVCLGECQSKPGHIQ
jgi:hypothetical protein